MDSRLDLLGESSSSSSSSTFTLPDLAHCTSPVSPYPLGSLSIPLLSQGGENTVFQFAQRTLMNAEMPQPTIQTSPSSSSHFALSTQQHPPEAAMVSSFHGNKRKKAKPSRLDSINDGEAAHLAKNFEDAGSIVVKNLGSISKQLADISEKLTARQQPGESELTKDVDLIRRMVTEYKAQVEDRMKKLEIKFTAYQTQTEQRLRNLEKHQPICVPGSVVSTPTYHSMSTPPSIQAIASTIESNQTTPVLYHNSPLPPLSFNPSYSSSSWSPRQFSTYHSGPPSPHSLYHRGQFSFPVHQPCAERQPIAVPQPLLPATRNPGPRS